MLLALQIWTLLGATALAATLVAGELTATSSKKRAARRKTPRTLATFRAKAA